MMSGTVLITGVNRGIGRALAGLYLERGWRVIGAVRDPASDGGLANEAPSGRLRLLAFDMRDGAAIAAATATVDEPVDVLINNAGTIGAERQSALDTDFAGFLDTIDINVLGPLRVTQAFLPQLRQARAAKILTVSSRMGSHADAESNRIAYRASKAALNRVMQALATDLRREGIAVCVAHPGWVKTAMGGESAALTPRESAEGLAALIDGLTLARSGGFYDYRGEEIPW